MGSAGSRLTRSKGSRLRGHGQFPAQQPKWAAAPLVGEALHPSEWELFEELQAGGVVVDDEEAMHPSE